MAEMSETDKYEVVTNHPTSAYQVSGENEATVLEILDEKVFWKSSKYLVIVIK